MYSHSSGRLVTQRRLFSSAKHRTAGMCSLSVQPGDEVWMIRDAAVPLILRRVEGGHQLVGEAYVHGFMNGEMLGEEYRLVDGKVVVV